MPAEAATDGRPYGEIKRMFVSPARRGERIGQRMLAALERDLRAARHRSRAAGDRAAASRGGRASTRAAATSRAAAYGGYPDNARASVFMEKRWKPD